MGKNKNDMTKERRDFAMTLYKEFLKIRIFKQFKFFFYKKLFIIQGFTNQGRRAIINKP